MSEQGTFGTGTTEWVDDLEDLFDNAPCGYVSVGPDGRITRANRTLAGWIGVEPEALLGRRFADLLTIGGKMFFETHFAPMLRMQGSFNEVALDLACPDGSTLPVLVNAAERCGERGELRSVRYTVFNATERRRYERSLLHAKVTAEAAVQAERDDAALREQFIAVLGHDLRNPLASIASGIRLLGAETLSDRGRRVLGLMDGSVVRASTLIDNVLDFARARLAGGITLNRERKSVEPILRQVVAELRAIAPERAIETGIDAPREVEADHARIGQLASNLLGNALTHGSADEPVRLAAVTDATTFRMWVANGGEPIAPEVMGHLFQPFFRGAVRNSQVGLGLGLHIAAEIAKAHGGTLTVESSGSETRFTFEMPRLATADPGSPGPEGTWTT